MNKCRLLLAVLAGTVIYCLVSIVAGRDGIWAQNQMLDQKRQLSAHEADIEKINQDLNMEKTALLNDMDVVAGYAHRLGYVYEGEKLVKITGLPEIETRIYDAGTVLKHQGVKYMSEAVCKCLGLFVGIMVFIVLLLIDSNRGIMNFGQKERFTEKGKAQVYDMSKI